MDGLGRGEVLGVALLDFIDRVLESRDGRVDAPGQRRELATIPSVDAFVQIPMGNLVKRRVRLVDTTYDHPVEQHSRQSSDACN